VEYAALKVQVGYGMQNGEHRNLWPDFGSLDIVKNDPDTKNWQKWLRVRGAQILGDRSGLSSSHFEATAHSPEVGYQVHLFLVPAVFAAQAVAATAGQTTPGGTPLVARATEAEAAAFYDEAYQARQPEDIVDAEALQAAIQLDVALKGPKVPAGAKARLQAKADAALDPDTDEPGIRKNWRAKFALAKAKFGWIILP